jgi:hypothetical protein
MSLPDSNGIDVAKKEATEDRGYHDAGTECRGKSEEIALNLYQTLASTG